MNDLILLHRDHEIATLTFNRPEARNALNWAMQNRFLELVCELVADTSVRVLILTGAGDHAFCAGGDLVELANYPHNEDGARVTEIMGEALNWIESAPFPSIAAMNGYALGGGSEIALACDLRIADETAQMGMVQARMGLTPGWGAGQRLLRLVGYSRAMELLLTAEPIKGQVLLEKGLVNRVAGKGGAYREALSLAQQIARWDRDVVQAVKRVLRYGLTLPYDQAQAAEQREFPPLWAAEAHLQAVHHFLNRKGNAPE